MSTMHNSLLNIFCFELPGYLTKPMYQEFDSRKTQIENIWAKGYQEYMPLREYEHVVDMLLALCIFYRYVLGNMIGASNFYDYLNHIDKEKDCGIRCGKFKLDHEQYNKLLSIAISFNKIREKYQLTDRFFEFQDTLGFLRNCKDLLNAQEYNTESNNSSHEDYPF